MNAEQLIIFDIELPRLKILGREYRSCNLLGPRATAGRFDMFINDALCEGYDYADHNDAIYFPNEQARDRYKQHLDEVCETDEKGNNLDGWHKTGDFQNGAFIHGIRRNWNDSLWNPESERRSELKRKYKID